VDCGLLALVSNDLGRNCCTGSTCNYQYAAAWFCAILNVLVLCHFAEIGVG